MRVLDAIVALSFILISCNYSVLKKPGLNDTNQVESLPQEAPVDWTLMSESVLNVCVSCHSGKRSPRLVTYADVSANLTKVWSEIDTAAMPPQSAGYSPLSSCKKAALKKWMDLGAPQVSQVKVSTLPECPADGPMPVPLPNVALNYDNLVKYILRPKCMGCHNPKDSSDASTTLFYPYSEIAADSHWDPPAAASKLYNVITRADADRMPPPETGAALTKDEIDFIARWIDAGRPQ